MQATTSIHNYFSLSGTGYGSNLVVRPPQHLKVFRATICVDSREDMTASTYLQISNAEINSLFEGVYLSNRNYTQNSVPVAPDTSSGEIVAERNILVLDRRGVGYMVDDLHITGKGGVSIIWEGIVKINDER